MAKKAAVRKKSTKKNHMKLVKPAVEDKLADKKMSMPLQQDGDICLIDTPPSEISFVAKPGELRDNLVVSKTKFLKEIHELSARYGVDIKVRVFFTLSSKE